MNWHKLTIQDTLNSLGSSLQGLSTIVAQEKLFKSGPNELEEGKKKSITGILLSQFKDVMILILVIAAFFNLTGMFRELKRIMPCSIVN